MNCERLEVAVLDLDRNGAVSDTERATALAHLDTCSRCAGLQESWRAAREELRTLGEGTMQAQTPARVEMRLLQAFRERHRRVTVRRARMAAAWALAAAAVVVGAVSWIHWQTTRNREIANHEATMPTVATKDSAVNAPKDASNASGQLKNVEPSISEYNRSDFTPLPGMLLAETDQTAILRVRMQRGTLGALGFPVNEETASEWIQVDLMIGDDGAPQAVRLAQ